MAFYTLSFLEQGLNVFVPDGCYKSNFKVDGQAVGCWFLMN